jgi:O-antigen/teichoic acid export membrane protein
MGFILGIAGVVMPTATSFSATGRMDELAEIFLKWSRIAYVIAALAAGYLLVFGPDFVRWWMGPAFEVPSGRVVRVLVVGYLFFLPVRGVASPLLMGLGRPGATAMAFLGMGLLNVGLSLVLVKPLGIVGVAIGTLVPCLLFAVVLALVACRALRIPFHRYAGYVFGRPTLGVLPAVLVLVGLKHRMGPLPGGTASAAGLIPLCTAGGAMAVVFLLGWVLLVYPGDPYLGLPAAIERFVPRALRRRHP